MTGLAAGFGNAAIVILKRPGDHGWVATNPFGNLETARQAACTGKPQDTAKGIARVADLVFARLPKRLIEHQKQRGMNGMPAR